MAGRIRGNMRNLVGQAEEVQPIVFDIAAECTVDTDSSRWIAARVEEADGGSSSIMKSFGT
jgi:hypothetical protein